MHEIAIGKSRIEVGIFDHANTSWLLSETNVPSNEFQWRPRQSVAQHDVRLVVRAADAPKAAVLFIDAWRRTKRDPQYVSVTWGPDSPPPQMWTAGIDLLEAAAGGAIPRLNTGIKWRLVTPQSVQSGNEPSFDDARRLLRLLDVETVQINAIAIKSRQMEFLVDCYVPGTLEGVQATVVWPAVAMRGWVQRLAATILGTGRDEYRGSFSVDELEMVLREALCVVHPDDDQGLRRQ